MGAQWDLKMSHAARTLSTLSLPSCVLLQGHLADSSKHTTASWVAIREWIYPVQWSQLLSQISFATQSSALPLTWHTVSTCQHFTANSWKNLQKQRFNVHDCEILWSYFCQFVRIHLLLIPSSKFLWWCHSCHGARPCAWWESTNLASLPACVGVYWKLLQCHSASI